MCGLACVWGADEPDIVNRMISTLVHRGPDASGTYQSEFGTLGHRRLSISEPEATEKWILRRAFEDALPEEIAWRRKAQFDEGAGVAERMTELSKTFGDEAPAPPARCLEEQAYLGLFRRQFSNPTVVGDPVVRWNDPTSRA